MKLNRLYWAIVDPLKDEIVWSYEEPLIFNRKESAEEALKEHRNMLKGLSSWMGHNKDGWNSFEIVKIRIDVA